ncbi:MAG: SurA N-terminal domain-containing protein [Rhodobacteraceae bacterium]|nr:SurA N-terminal domain-containing protein [Paracoccaceae bacterium]
MAKAARKPKTANILVWILIGLLVVSLMGFGIVSFTGTSGAVGTVGKEDIPVNTYFRALRDRLNQARQIGLENVPLAEISQITLQQLASEASIDNEASSIGLSVDDTVVLAALRDSEAFKGLDGRFDTSMYELALERSGMSASEYDDELRQTRSRQIILQAVAAGLSASDVYARTVVGYNFQERDIRWLELDNSFITDELPEPTDADLRSFYSDHEELFTLPETRVITYAYLLPNMLIDQVMVDEQQIVDLYNARIDEFVRPERRILERLVFLTESEAAAAKARIDNDEATFDQLLEEAGILPQDAFVGDVGKDELGEQDADAVFAIEEPGIVGPVQSNFGPALYRVIAILAERNDSIDDARGTIERQLALQQAESQINSSIETYSDLLAGGASIEELAAETAMQLATVDFNESAGGQVVSDQEFRRAALQATEFSFSEILLLNGGGVFALRLDRLVPPTLQDFSTVRDQVVNAWREDFTLQAKRRVGEEYKSALEAGTPFSEIGLLDANFVPGILRGNPIAGAPAGTVEEAFNLQQGEVAIVDDGRVVVLVRLEAVRDADFSTDNIQGISQYVNSQFAQTAAEDLIILYATQLIADAGFRIDQAAINTVHSYLQ